jgi:hypothetical protein
MRDDADAAICDGGVAECSQAKVDQMKYAGFVLSQCLWQPYSPAMAAGSTGYSEMSHAQGGPMNSLRAIAATALLAAATANCLPVLAQTSPPAASAGCAAANGWNLICGNENPEDLVPLPGTHWLIASGMKEGAGLKLVDTDAKTARLFYTGQPAQQRPDKNLFPNCPAPPEAKTFNAHGLYLRRAQEAGLYKLYAVNHGALESIQVFTVDAKGAQPSLTWIGCVPMPEGNKAYPSLGAPATSSRLAANSVAAFSDGTIIATVPNRPGTTNRQRLSGEPTGDVVEWKPGTDSFRVLPGTQLAGNNGIEIALDEKEFYVVAFGTHTVFAFSRQDPRKPLRQTVAPGFMPDNLRWSGNRLIAAGPMVDEPACGGTRLAVVDDPVLTACHRGFMFAQLDPKTMAWTILAYAEPNPVISVVSTGVVVGDTLWVGSAASEAIAYRALPRPASGVR